MYGILLVGSLDPVSDFACFILGNLYSLFNEVY